MISPKRFFRQGGLAWSLRRGAIKLAVAAAEMNNGVASGTFREGLINSPQMRDTTVSCRGLIHAADVR
ncbi:hypothetical protein DGN16_10585 [Xanthomonas citri pv. fuscans]|uniref:Uncharacterized protein n=1 Tax=Xanthomonas citri pv. phaseoli var. fuscans TaxID=473423 RepID=A0A808FKG9_XANCI|nr:hypothetical protein DGN16_10585 [Xanthomonas citri pv. fuscans]QWN08218.1 hypothetical protein DGN11_13015 [Xanthomonas citri pv. fuscans]QWN11969.1 hypothetical protein DGN07_10730 [Xanthomonas citri pv. fuscans]